MTDKEYFKALSVESLDKALNSIRHSFDVLYDKYHGDNNTSDDIFMYELIDTIRGIEIATYVYVRDGEIHPGYVLEKLTMSLSQLQCNMRYWESKLESEKNKNEKA